MKIIYYTLSIMGCGLILIGVFTSDKDAGQTGAIAILTAKVFFHE